MLSQCFFAQELSGVRTGCRIFIFSELTKDTAGPFIVLLFFSGVSRIVVFFIIHSMRLIGCREGGINVISSCVAVFRPQLIGINLFQKKGTVFVVSQLS